MFARGFTLFRVRGIPVRLDLSLLLFLPYVAFVSSRQFVAFATATASVGPNELTIPPLVWGVILALGLFVSVLLHELAHALVALRSGGRVHSITLMMLGGVTRMESDVRPEREAWMAFAGPLTSFAIALVSFLAFRLVPLPPGPTVALSVFAATNAVLGGFNLLPAFPMDGGRVLRALLAPRVGLDRATRVAATLGKAMAVVFALVGLVSYNLLLVLIAGFVFLGASAEATRRKQHDALRGVPVGLFMSERLGEVSEDESAAELASRLLRDNLVGAKVIAGDAQPGHHRTLGVVTVADLTRGRPRLPGATPVVAAMRTDLPKVHRFDDGAVTMDALSSGQASAVVVVDEADEVIGVVTLADLERVVALRTLATGDVG
jgi:Zn-dependent protease